MRILVEQLTKIYFAFPRYPTDFPLRSVTLLLPRRHFEGEEAPSTVPLFSLPLYRSCHWSFSTALVPA